MKKPSVETTASGRAVQCMMYERICKHFYVFDSMRPEIGTVHTAEKIQSNYATMQNYIIPGIGKYGLLIRENECEEVGA